MNRLPAKGKGGDAVGSTKLSVSGFPVKEPENGNRIRKGTQFLPLTDTAEAA